MRISPLNPIEFFPLLAPATHVAAAAVDLTLADLAVTFNLEDKKGVVKAAKKYYHKIVYDQAQVLDFIVDDTGHTYEIEVFTREGVFIDNIALSQIGSTDHFTGSILISSLGDPDLSIARLFFVLVDVTDTNILAITDLIDVTPTIPDRHVAITYQNGRTYADTHSSLEFTTMVRASFMRQGFPEDKESNSYADGTPVLLSSTVRTQRLLKVLPAPAYIHKKLTLALKCSTVTIDGKTWVQEEAYNLDWIGEDSEFGNGRVMLTQTDGTYRNVLANE